jgi:hypothetical protein
MERSAIMGGEAVIGLAGARQNAVAVAEGSVLLEDCQTEPATHAVGMKGS